MQPTRCLFHSWTTPGMVFLKTMFLFRGSVSLSCSFPEFDTCKGRSNPTYLCNLWLVFKRLMVVTRSNKHQGHRHFWWSTLHMVKADGTWEMPEWWTQDSRRWLQIIMAHPQWNQQKYAEILCLVGNLSTTEWPTIRNHQKPIDSVGSPRGAVTVSLGGSPWSTSSTRQVVSDPI